jgi:S-adenosylmethionine hydrolase
VARSETVSFLSDYGLQDEFVGVVKSVIRHFAPHAAVVDLTHEIAPHDVRAGSLALARACQYLAPGVVLAVVDPGVGTDRRAVAVEAASGELTLVGPDNGLLAAAVALLGGADRAVSLTNAEYHIPSPGPTFAGRDVFAPAAGHLAAGVDLLELGEAIEPLTLVPGMVPLTRIEDGALVAEVLWVDRYGNVQLNVDPDEVADFGERVRLTWGGGPSGGGGGLGGAGGAGGAGASPASGAGLSIGGSAQVRVARRAGAYGELKAGEVGLVVDSYGLLSICLERRSAADELRLRPGDAVTLAEPQ